MRRTTSAVAVAAIATTFLGAATAAAQSTTAVDIQDNSFVEAAITITVGDTVQWTQSGSNPHSVTASDGSFDSSPGCPPDFTACLGTGDTFSETFDTAGTFTYYCKVHGSADGSGMAGTITVEAAAATTAPTEPEPTASATSTSVPDLISAPEPDETPAPELSATGVAAGPLALAAGVVVGLGLLGLAVARRRTRLDT